MTQRSGDTSLKLGLSRISMKKTNSPENLSKVKEKLKKTTAMQKKVMQAMNQRKSSKRNDQIVVEIDFTREVLDADHPDTENTVDVHTTLHSMRVNQIPKIANKSRKGWDKT